MTPTFFLLRSSNEFEEFFVEIENFYFLTLFSNRIVQVSVFPVSSNSLVSNDFYYGLW